MENRFHIGVDGGGTKTAFAVSDATTNNIVCRVVTKGINYNYLGVDQAVSNFLSGINEICSKLNITNDSIDAIAIGDPSVDEFTTLNTTIEFIDRIKNNLNPQTKVYIHSDVFMTLYGLTGGQPGVLMISGTGSMGIAMNNTGDLFTFGGWGYLTEDEGSGYYIAINGIKTVLHYFDGIGPKTSLTQKAFDFFNISSERDLIQILYPEEGSPNISGFSKYVGQSASEGDEEAIKILNAAGDILSKGVEILITKANISNPKVGVYGSVLTHDKIVRSRFENNLKNKYPNIEIVEPNLKPEDAALEFISKNIKEEII